MNNISIRQLEITEEYWVKETTNKEEMFFGNTDTYWVKKNKYTTKIQYFLDGEWKDIPIEKQIIKCSDKNPDEELYVRKKY